MINIQKQIEYWHQGSQEDWAVAQELVDRGRVRHGLFFAHLALEKILKAHVCAKTQDLAPRTHNLVHLAEIAGLALGKAQGDTLAEMNEYASEGRYPDLMVSTTTVEEARGYMKRCQEVLACLMRKL